MKMLENPCFIISLQTGAKIIAALDIVLAAIPLAIILSGVIPSYNGRSYEYNIVDDIGNPVTDGAEVTTVRTSNTSVVNVIVKEKDSYFDTGIWTIMIFFVVIDIAVSYVLFTGSKNKHLKKLKMWFYIRTVTLVLIAIMLIASICLGITFRLVVYDCFHTIYRIYTLWVVHAFIQEILTENRRLQNATYYTQAFGRPPPSIVVTSAATEHNNADNNAHSNGGSKFGFENIAYT